MFLPLSVCPLSELVHPGHHPDVYRRHFSISRTNLAYVGIREATYSVRCELAAFSKSQYSPKSFLALAFIYFLRLERSLLAPNQFRGKSLRSASSVTLPRLFRSNSPPPKISADRAAE